MITGGAGFIGSHVVRLFVQNYPQYKIINYDALTYAGNLENLKDIEGAENYIFEKGDITDEQRMNELFEKYDFDGVIHLAAESHVDRSIIDPLAFVRTNVLGTTMLLNVCRKFWEEKKEGKLFYHVSTDEVYGSLKEEGFFTETASYDPRSPYAASKASSDHFVMAYHHTYGMPVVISNCSNNYGSHHLPVYGKGENIRDWLWVEDHASAINVIFHKGKSGEKYNIGGCNEWKNIDLVHLLCYIMDKKLGRKEGTSAQLITYVKDRAGHDLRYAIDATKLTTELGWRPSLQFEEGLEKTVDWYLQNEDWINDVTSGNYQRYYDEQYVIR